MEARPYVVGREKTSLVTLTERGRELLELIGSSAAMPFGRSSTPEW